MLAPVISDECIELLVAYTLTRVHCYSIPRATHTAFLRFLLFLSTFDFADEPIIVDTSDSLSVDDITAIQKFFRDNRSSLPAIFIATPYVSKRLVERA
jgi:U3 small nucleolar RNA-associated protein 22